MIPTIQQGQFGRYINADSGANGSGNMPTYVGAGLSEAYNGIFSVRTVSWPSGNLTNDLGVMVCCTTFGRSFTLPTGWAELTNFSVQDGSNGAAVYVFWKYHDGSETGASVSIGESTGLGAAQIMSWRGVHFDATNGPFDVLSVSGASSSTATVTFPSITTTETNSVCLLVAARAATGFPWFASTTMGNLGAFSETSDSGFSSGPGGSFAFGRADFIGVGDVGSVTGTCSLGATITKTMMVNIFG